MENKETFIYILFDPRMPEVVRYVGKTIDVQRRMADYKRSANTNTRRHVCNWIKSLFREGICFAYYVVDSCTEKWEEREKHWIAHYRSLGCPLTNHTDGGEGALGFKHTDETKDRMREVQSRLKVNLGRYPSEETRKKLSAAKAGRKLSEGQVKKIREMHVGRKCTEEQRQRMREAQQKVDRSFITEEYRANMAEAVKGVPKNRENTAGSGYKYVYNLPNGTFRVRVAIGDTYHSKCGFKTAEEANDYVHAYLTQLEQTQK